MSETLHVYTVFVPEELHEAFYEFLDNDGNGISERYEHTETRETR